MIVVHVNTMPDTARMTACYEGLPDLIVLTNPGYGAVKKVLKEHPQETVMLMGHGSAKGLFTGDMKGFLIDSKDVYLLRDRVVIGLWCYAAEFADKYGLHGFFSSMFISNLEEALWFNYYETDAKEVDKEFDLYCIRIHELLRSKTPLDEWVKYLQDRADISKGFVRFNYEALCCFE